MTAPTDDVLARIAELEQALAAACVARDQYKALYQRLTLVVGSVVIGTLASIWMVERSLSLKLLAF